MICVNDNALRFWTAEVGALMICGHAASASLRNMIASTLILLAAVLVVFGPVIIRFTRGGN